jgi:hypothetical protein
MLRDQGWHDYEKYRINQAIFLIEYARDYQYLNAISHEPLIWDDGLALAARDHCLDMKD